MNQEGNKLLSVPIRRFGTRVNLFMGGDREMVMFSGLMAFALAFSALTVVAGVFSFCFWVICLFLCRRIAKSDPLMRFVYLRHIQYQRFYSARSTPFCKKIRDYK